MKSLCKSSSKLFLLFFTFLISYWQWWGEFTVIRLHFFCINRLMNSLKIVAFYSPLAKINPRQTLQNLSFTKLNPHQKSHFRHLPKYWHAKLKWANFSAELIWDRVFGIFIYFLRKLHLLWHLTLNMKFSANQNF